MGPGVLEGMQSLAQLTQGLFAVRRRRVNRLKNLVLSVGTVMAYRALLGVAR
jgi:hypothetical protein